MKKTIRRSAVLLLALVLLLNCAPVALADASEDPPAETSGEQLTETAPETTPEVPEEPAPEVPAEPAPEVTAEPAPEVTGSPAEGQTTPPETTAEPTGEPEVTADPAASPEPSTSPEPSASPEPGADAAAVQALVDALPEEGALMTMGGSAQDAVYTQLQAAYDAFMALPAEQQALVTGADKFEALFNVFNAMISTTAVIYQYYDPTDGQMHNVPDNSYTADMIPYMKDPSLMAGNWFVVQGSLNIEKIDRLSSVPLPVSGSGEVNILLLDGSTLTIEKGVKFTAGGQSVKIWGGQNGTGKLVVDGRNNPAFNGSNGAMGALTVNGGVVELKSYNANMITVPSVALNRGEVNFTYTYDSNNGPVVGGTLTIAPGVFVSGSNVELSSPVNAAGEKLYPVTFEQLQEMTPNWGATYTLDGTTYPYREPDHTSQYHTNCALWLPAGGHNLTTENNILITIAEDGAVTWTSDYTADVTVPIPYYDPTDSRVKQHEAIALTREMKDLESGKWYFVPSEGLDHDNDYIHINGDVNLILTNGSRLYTSYGIYINDGATLTIWSQSRGGSGVIDVTNANVGYWRYDDWDKDYNYYYGYVMPAAIGGGDNFTLNLMGGTINATANHRENDAPAVGLSGVVDTWHDAHINVYGGVLNAVNGTYNGAAIGTGFEVYGRLWLDVYGGAVNATQSVSAYSRSGIGCYWHDGEDHGDTHLTMHGGSLSVSSTDIGIYGAIDYRGGTLSAKGDTSAVSAVPNFTGSPHVTTNNGKQVESTLDPKPWEGNWENWTNVTIRPETMTGTLAVPDGFTVASGSVTEPVHVTWNGQDFMDQVNWTLPEGFSLDGEWRLHIGNVADGPYTVSVRYGEYTASFEVRVDHTAAYFDPDDEQNKPVPELRDAEDVGCVLGDGWYEVFDPEPLDITVQAGAHANLLVQDVTTTTKIRDLTLGAGATLTIWGQEQASGEMTISGTVKADSSNKLIVKGGTVSIDTTDATFLCPLELRDGAVTMNKLPAYSVTTVGGSLYLPESIRGQASVKDEAGTALVCAVVPNPSRETVIIEGRQYRPSYHIGVDTNLYPWLTPEDHLVTLGNTTCKLIYDKDTNSFRFDATQQEATYYDPIEGKSHTLEPGSYTLVTKNTLQMTNGWYVVDQAVTAKDRIYVSGMEVNLVLLDSGKLTAPGGIEVGQGSGLTIWSTETGYMGASSDHAALYANAGGYYRAAGIGGGNYWQSRNGDITINGGHIDAIGGGRGGAGIGGGEDIHYTIESGTITINAGTVYGSYGYAGFYTIDSAGGIGGGAPVVINGGSVTAKGGNAPGIAPNDHGRMKLTINGGSVYSAEYSSQYDYLYATGVVAADPVNSDGEALYRLDLPNPDGEPVTIDGKEWNVSVHRGPGADQVNYDPNYLYAYVPIKNEDKVVHVTVGDTEYLYMLVNGALQLVEGSVQTHYYDLAKEEAITVNYAMPLSHLTPNGEGIIDLNGTDTLCWFLADEDPENLDLLRANGNVNLIIPDGVTLDSRIYIGQGSTLTLWFQEEQTGQVAAKAGTEMANAGIELDNWSNLIINGGAVTAQGGGVSGAGIGTHAAWKDWNNDVSVTINYGNVTATGGHHSAGIGAASLMTLTVNGGTIKATGGEKGEAANGGAGIGSSDTDGYVRLVMNDGDITATGGGNAPGIGASAASATLTIKGGTIHAQGGNGMPGIGIGPYVTNSIMELTMDGGAVEAVGGEGAPGIGVKNPVAEDYWCASNRIHLNGGTLTTQGGEGAADIETQALTPSYYLQFTIDGGSVKFLNHTNGTRVSPQPYNTAGAEVYPLVVENPDGEPVTINGTEWTGPVNHTAVDPADTNLYLYLPGEDVTINVGSMVWEYVFDEADKTFVELGKDPVEYYDPEAGETLTHPALSLKATYTTWKNRWYILDSDIGPLQNYITVEGDVNLILADGCSLTMDTYRAITVNEGSSLTIWGQKGQTGRLTVSEAPYAAAGIGGARGGYNAGKITINGGVIYAKGGVYAAGIGGGANRGAGDITINYGNVTAIGGVEARGFSGAGIGTGWDNLHSNTDTGKITINGGTVNASGAGTRGSATGDGAGIGTGYGFIAGVDITINGGTITATGGNGAYGIGSGRNSSGGSTVITGGSVKADGGLGPVNPRPTNGTEAVYLLTVSNPDGQPVYLDGKEWSPRNHKALDPADGSLYAYVPGKDTAVTVGGVQTQYLFDSGLFATEADYDWNSESWTWSADSASATLTVPRTDRTDPSLTRTVLTNVTETKPTCETTGTRIYTAKLTVLGHSYTGTKNVETPATGHNWDVTGRVYPPTLSDSRTVTVYCLNDHEHTFKALLREDEEDTAAYEPPVCGQEKDGARYYDRTFTLNGETYKFDRVKVTVPWSHTWGPWQEVSGSEAGTTLVRTCKVCGKEETSNHWHEWQLPSNEPHGSTADVTWTLGQDGEYGVTVHVTCAVEGCEYSAANGGMYIPIDPSQITYDKDKTVAPTCTAPGHTVYKVTLTLPEKDGEVSETYYSDEITLPATGHQWGEPTFEFAQKNGDPYDANETCTMTLHCQNKDCTATQTVTDAAVTGEQTTAPTCEDAGVMTVTAKAVYEGKTYTSEPQTRSIDALGHDYTTATVKWADDHTSAVVTLTCSRDVTHTKDVTVPASAIGEPEITAPTCDTQGATTYTLDAAQAIQDAGVTFSGNTLFSDSVSIPALGHDWDVEGNEHKLQAGVDGDYTTLTIFCTRDPSHTQTVYTKLERVKEHCVDATCSEEGFEAYKMTFEFNGPQEVEGEGRYPIPKLPHTWSEWTESEDASGNVTYTRKCKVCGDTETTNHRHEYVLPDEAIWDMANGQPVSVTVQAACRTCGSLHTLTYLSNEIDVDEALSKAPTCDADGVTVYTVTAELDGQVRTYLYSQPVPATGHKWVRDEAAGGLSDDYSMYTFVFRCSVCNKTVAQTVDTVSEILSPATCEAPGEMSYHADLELDGKIYSFAEKKTIPAIGHDWDPEGVIMARTMETENGFVTVTIYCRHDPSHAQTVYATRKLVKDACVEADCTTPGTDVYTLSYTFDGVEYDLPQMVEYAIPALGHLWDENGHCTRDGCEAQLPAGTYSWDLPDPNDTTGRVLWSDPPTGGKPYLTLQVIRTNPDGTTTVEEVVITDVDAKQDRYCEKTGSTLYTAEVTLGGKSQTYTTSINDLPPTGHDWTFDPEDVVWSDDNTKATFTFRCGNKDWHEGGDRTKTVDVSQRVTKEPTCTKEGILELTATAQIDTTTATAKKTVTLERLGHIWDTKNYTTVWSEDYTTAAFTFTCLRDESHTRTETVNAERTTLKAADCTTDGLDRWSASYTMEDGTTVTAYQDVVTPALGHDYKDGVCTRCKEKDPNYKASTATAAATKAPNTGDETALLPWTVLLLACAAALTAVLQTRRRRQ